MENHILLLLLYKFKIIKETNNKKKQINEYKK